MKILLFVVLYYYYFLSKVSPFFIQRKKRNGVLYLSAFFPGNAGYHWREKVWSDELIKSGQKVDILHVFSGEEFQELYGKRHSLFLIKFLIKRYAQVKLAAKYEVVIVRRELLLYNDYGNLFLEKMLLKLNKNAILDFDDDLSAAKAQPKEISNWFGRLLMEDGNKFNNSIKLYSKFIVASNYLKNCVLKERAGKESNIIIIPTCVNYQSSQVKKYPEKIEKYTIGWIGGDYNYFLLDDILPILNKLTEKYKFKLLVISGENYERKVNFEIEFRPWKLETEVKNLLDIDIGIMPLKETDISKGKGGFKLIQYMGLGIVSIASPITINKEIIDDEINSFLAKGADEWENIFDKLLSGQVNFNTMGKMARKKVEEYYTVEANKTKYLEFILEDTSSIK